MKKDVVLTEIIREFGSKKGVFIFYAIIAIVLSAVIVLPISKIGDDFYNSKESEGLLVLQVQRFNYAGISHVDIFNEMQYQLNNAKYYFRFFTENGIVLFGRDLSSSEIEKYYARLLEHRFLIVNSDFARMEFGIHYFDESVEKVNDFFDTFSDYTWEYILEKFDALFMEAMDNALSVLSQVNSDPQLSLNEIQVIESKPILDLYRAALTVNEIDDVEIEKDSVLILKEKSVSSRNSDLKIFNNFFILAVMLLFLFSFVHVMVHLLRIGGWENSKESF
jgi:hypothetical protein